MKHAKMDPEFLKIICCPETHQELRPAEPSLVEDLNRRIAKGDLRNRAGQSIKEQLDGGLVRGDGKYLYPIHRNIPVLLVDEAVPVAG